MLARIRSAAARRLAAGVDLPRVLLYAALSQNRFEGQPLRLQPLLCMGRGRITFGTGVAFGVHDSPARFTTYAYVEARNAAASITIGDRTWVNNNACLIADHTSISIGSDCLIGHNVQIFDSDFHGLLPDERRSSKPEWARPVSVGNNVFIGANVTILKGVTVGDDAVIAGGSVVTRNVPAASVVGGNPAKVVRSLRE